MKKIMVMAMMAAVIALTVCAQSTTAEKLAANGAKISLADARSRIDKAIENPELMKSIMQHLSATNQVLFLSDVNKAISDMPASTEEKTAKFLNANSAALRGAAPGNVSALVAEVFATVPPESLTVLNERFAADLFNRADTSMSDEQFAKVAEDLVKRVNDRVSGTDDAAPRSALAIAMMVRASGGSPADLTDKLVDTMPQEESRELARTEWLPSALGTDGRQQGYESVLASSDSPAAPNNDFVLTIAGPQYHDVLLNDLGGGITDPAATSGERTPAVDAVQSLLERELPILGDDRPGAAGAAGGSKAPPYGGDADQKVTPTPTPNPTPTPTPTPHPAPYQWQNTGV